MFDLNQVLQAGMQAGKAAMMQNVQNQLQVWVDWLLKDALSPDFMKTLQQMLRGMGMDTTQLPGMVGKEQGFDPYRVLGLDKTATDEEVKSRYRELLRKLHPDTAGVEGTDFLLQMVMAAYKLIESERGWS